MSVPWYQRWDERGIKYTGAYTVVAQFVLGEKISLNPERHTVVQSQTNRSDVQA